MFIFSQLKQQEISKITERSQISSSIVSKEASKINLSSRELTRSVCIVDSIVPRSSEETKILKLMKIYIGNSRKYNTRNDNDKQSTTSTLKLNPTFDTKESAVLIKALS